MVLDRKRAMMWLVVAVRGSFQSVQSGDWGLVRVIVVEDVATQEVGYLLVEAL